MTPRFRAHPDQEALTTPTLRSAVATFKKLAEAKAALQLVEYRAKAREIEVVVRERRAWAVKQRAACEWLLQRQYQHAVRAGASQLDALRAKVVLFSTCMSVQLCAHTV